MASLARRLLAQDIRQWTLRPMGEHEPSPDLPPVDQRRELAAEIVARMPEIALDPMVQFLLDLERYWTAGERGGQ